MVLQKKITLSEEHYRCLVERSPDIIYTLDKEGRFTFVSDAVERITGFPPHSLIGKDFAFLFSPEDQKKAANLFERSKTAYGDELNAELKLTNQRHREQIKECELRQYNVAMSMCEADNPGNIHNKYFAFGIIRDISEKKQLEIALNEAKKLEAIETLAGGIAHEFNNLFMVIQGLVSLMLLKVEPDHYLYDKLRKVEEYVQKGARLTGQVLNFASERLKHRGRPLNVNYVLDDTIDLFVEAQKNITIERVYEKEIWKIIADPKQLKQVFTNIFMNAAYAMPYGGTIKIVTENVVIGTSRAEILNLTPGRFVKISITDTGTGMDEETRSRIFDPFFTTREVGKGKGLGLSAAYGIIKAYNGYIRVNSVEKKGTTFDIFFPAPGKRSDNRDVQVRPKTIMLVEHDPLTMEMGTEILNELGYRVICASSGKEALSLYGENKEQVDVVLIDLDIPDMMADDLLSRIRGINPEVKILFTGVCSEHNIFCPGFNCKNFVHKPFSANELHKKLETLLS